MANKTDSDAEYLRQVLPVLVTYTRQVVFAVDLDRLCHIASRTDAQAPEWRFLNAMRDFRNAANELEGLFR